MSELRSESRPLLIYLHGFLSSPQSYKCQVLRDWLASTCPQVIFYAPLISPYPAVAAQALDRLVETFSRSNRGPIGLAGSSMGGFWASYLAERHNLPAVVINPAVTPSRFMPRYVGQTLLPYSGEAIEYRLTPDDVATMRQLEASLPIPLASRYWLLGQRGDETLDCREAEQYYRGQRQTIEEGGDHSFQSFDRFCEPLTDFLFPALAKN